MPPTTVQALLILIVVAIPGVVYYTVRDASLASYHAERDLASKTLRAITVGLTLDAIYVLAFGPALAGLVKSAGLVGRLDPAADPRPIAAAGLALLVIVPALGAVAEARLVRRRGRARYDATPSAWDHLFRDRGGCFIRVRTGDGAWVGGWYGTGSYASAFPHDHDLYLTSQYRMNSDGSFGPRVKGTGGVFVSGSDIRLLEVVHAPEQQPLSPEEEI
ncbi:DUF6338 family protein [Nonomuraea sp. NPDC049714]|uniref:DUF6338 family protein n=1 Tax=Nonomuraea sp. NPDC049714 TaxID=3364357 RepID=UPI00379D11E6